jgi:hypothetical protein
MILTSFSCPTHNVANEPIVWPLTLVVLTTSSSNPGFKDAATILAFIGGIAIAIERVIETIWTESMRFCQ